MAARRKPRDQYHHGDLRSALVASAWAVVSRRGVEHLSLRGVAEELGVSHAAPAHHFANKDELIEALRTESFRRFADVLEPASHQVDPLRATGRAYLRFARAHPRQVRLMFLEGPAGPSADTQLQAQRAWAALSTAVATHLGPKRAHDVAATVVVAWASVHGLASLLTEMTLPAGLPPDDVLVQRLLDVVAEGALAA